MYSKNAPFRYDFVGSFLRPAPIKAARAAFAAGELDAAGLKEVEDREIRKLISRQKAAGYHTITDGEFRRSYWHLDFMWGLQGLQEITLDHGYIFHGEETTPGSVQVVGKISGENHPFVEHFKFVKQFEDDNTVARQTIPAPAQLYAELFREENGKATRAVYPDDDALLSRYCRRLSPGDRRSVCRRLPQCAAGRLHLGYVLRRRVSAVPGKYRREAGGRGREVPATQQCCPGGQAGGPGGDHPCVPGQLSLHLG